MRLFSVTLLLAGLLVLILYRRGRKKATVQEIETLPAYSPDNGIIKQIKAVDSVILRVQQLQKAWENREENLLDDFDYQLIEEWNPAHPLISDQDKEAIIHFMEYQFEIPREQTTEDLLLAGGEYIDEQWIGQRLNSGEMEELKGTEVYIKQKKNIEEAIASGQFNDAVSKLVTF